VGGSGPADDRVGEPGVEASVLVTGQIDHARYRSIGADPARAPDVFIDAKRVGCNFSVTAVTMDDVDYQNRLSWRCTRCDS
jgi:hypothetical protein